MLDVITLANTLPSRVKQATSVAAEPTVSSTATALSARGMGWAPAGRLGWPSGGAGPRGGVRWPGGSLGWAFRRRRAAGLSVCRVAGLGAHRVPLLAPRRFRRAGPLSRAPSAAGPAAEARASPRG